MSKMLAVLTAILMFWMIALPGPADAAKRGAHGIRNLDQYELSAQRRCVRMPPYSYRPYCYYYRPYYYRSYYYWPDYYGPSYGYISPNSYYRYY